MHGAGGAWARWILFGASACFAVGCGGSDDPPPKAAPDCGTVSNPDDFVITNVEPAVGASVANAAIIHRFKIVGSLYVDMTLSSMPAGHTAGAPMPDPTWGYTLEADGASYMSSAVTWTTAPGHVEIQFGGAYQDPDGCILAFPSPLFSYEITAP